MHRTAKKSKNSVIPNSRAVGRKPTGERRGPKAKPLGKKYVKITISLPASVLAALDVRRGNLTRSAAIAKLIDESGALTE